ncbi:MAG: sigma-70 family RNA polymerase sigma factor [Sandaracinaceae bacterium]
MRRFLCLPALLRLCRQEGLNLESMPKAANRSTDESARERRDVVAAALVMHEAALRAFIAARVPASEVDDIVQAAAVHAVERADGLQDPARVRAWLYRLYRNKATDALRARAREAKWVDRHAPPPEPLTQPSMRPCACGLSQLQRMPAPQAEILRLVDVEAHAVSEAASALGISANNAAVRLHRARRALRERMKRHCGVTSFADCQSCRCAHDGCCAA